MGRVYRAHDRRLNREVAVKVLPPEFLHDPERRCRFQREARILALLDHPNIAALHEFVQRDGAAFIVMQRVEGETLQARIRRGRLSPEELRSVFGQMAQALKAAHAQGIVHRDLKPANVMLGPSGHVTLLDFGLAQGPSGSPRAAGSDATVPMARVPWEAVGASSGMGTPAYMSPEQVRGLPLDHRADIWAFGCCLFEALAGRPAFDEATAADVFAAILLREPDWTALPAGAPPSLCGLARRCLRKDPKERPGDIEEAVLGLDVCAFGLDGPRRPLDPTGPIPDGHPALSMTDGPCPVSESPAVAVGILLEAAERLLAGLEAESGTGSAPRSSTNRIGCDWSIRTGRIMERLGLAYPSGA